MSEDDRLLILVGFFGIGLRVLLLAGGSWQDAKSEVRYTDIDYNVFTDAAGYVASGESPYLRSTYRYTPLLAYVLLPNIWAHDLFGKIIFCAAELQATRSVVYLLKEQKVPNRTIAVCTLISLINPYTATISTRGNGEAIVFSMLLCMVSFLAKGQIGAASIWYGLATHWRLFPIIHCIPLLCFLGSRRPALKKAADKVGMFQRTT